MSKRFGDRVAFEEVSFEVGHGEVSGFLGPDGAGKTTTVRTLGTLIAPPSGSATIGRSGPATGTVAFFDGPTPLGSAVLHSYLATSYGILFIAPHNAHEYVRGSPPMAVVVAKSPNHGFRRHPDGPR